MASILTIGGSVVNRQPAHVLINQLTHSLDSPDELTFTEMNSTLPGSYHLEQSVTLDIDGVREFSGWIFSSHRGSIGRDCPSVGYRCLDLRYGASLVPITASDGTGSMRWNLPVSDDFYQSASAGKSVGDILKQVLAQHSAALGAMGISTDATTDTQLDALIAVPPEATYIQGNDLWSQCLQLLTTWYASKYALWITAGGLIRCHNTTTMLAETLTLDSDPIILESLTEETSECFTQVCLRGAGDVEPYVAKLSWGTLIDPNNPTPEDTWTILDFLYPKDGFSSGSITAQTSTTITISSDEAGETWPANYWSGISGEIAVINPAITGVADFTGSDWRRITANTALGAGGTSTITVDRPFTTTGFLKYEIRGSPPGKSECYRRLNLKNRAVAQHLATRFPKPVRWSPSEGAVMATNTPQAVICQTPSLTSSITQWPLNFEVVPYDGTTDGYIRFFVPWVTIVDGNGGPFGQPLFTGGAAVHRPSDIIVMVPFARGALQAIAPMPGGTPGYSGTAYTRFGIQRTLYREYPEWLDRNDLTSMQTLASEILDTVCNVTMDGNITYYGKYAAALYSGSWPFALNLAKATGTTSYESMAAPVRAMTLEWPQSGATPWVTRLRFSTRRQQYSGDRLYIHPMYAYQAGERGQFAAAGQILAVGAPLAGAVAAGLPTAMGGYAGETGVLPTATGQTFAGAAGGPLGYTPVGQAGPGGANLPGYGTARTALQGGLGGVGGREGFLTAATPNLMMQEAQQRQAEQRQELMGRTGAAGQAALPAGFMGYEVAGTRAPPMFNPYAQAREAFAGLGMTTGEREAPAQFARERPMPLPPPLPLPPAERVGTMSPGELRPFSRIAPPRPEREAQGLRGVTTTEERREEKAAERGREDKIRREDTAEADRRENEQRRQERERRSQYEKD